MGKGKLDTKAKKLAAADRKQTPRRVSEDGRGAVLERALQRAGLSYVGSQKEEGRRRLCEALAEERFVDLTPKQARWLVEYVVTGNAMEAARRAYPDGGRDSASSIAYHNKRVLRDYIIDIFDLLGLDVVLTVQKLMEGLNATKMSRASYEGIFVDEKEDPDYRVRHDYLDMLLKLRGEYAPERHEVTADVKEVESPEALAARVAAYKRMLELERGLSGNGA